MTTPMDAKLLPCPFCNTPPNSGCNYGIGGAYVNCVNRDCLCNPEIFIAAVHNPDCSLSLDDALIKAKAAWQTRTPPSTPSPEVDKTFTLESALDYLRAHNDGVYKITASKNCDALVRWLLNNLAPQGAVRVSEWHLKEAIIKENPMGDASAEYIAKAVILSLKQQNPGVQFDEKD